MWPCQEPKSWQGSAAGGAAQSQLRLILVVALYGLPSPNYSPRTKKMRIEACGNRSGDTEIGANARFAILSQDFSTSAKASVG